MSEKASEAEAPQPVKGVEPPEAPLDKIIDGTAEVLGKIPGVKGLGHAIGAGTEKVVDGLVNLDHGKPLNEGEAKPETVGDQVGSAVESMVDEKLEEAGIPQGSTATEASAASGAGVSAAS